MVDFISAMTDDYFVATCEALFPEARKLFPQGLILRMGFNVVQVSLGSRFVTIDVWIHCFQAVHRATKHVNAPPLPPA